MENQLGRTTFDHKMLLPNIHAMLDNLIFVIMLLSLKCEKIDQKLVLKALLDFSLVGSDRVGTVIQQPT